MANRWFQPGEPVQHDTHTPPSPYETRLEVFERQVQDAFYDFFGGGGFIKELPCVAEYWERRYRQHATCKHGLLVQKCVGCRVHTPAYMPTHPV